MIDPLIKDKLLVALVLEDIVKEINTALQARKAILTLDYIDGRVAYLIISMPGCKPAKWLTADPRSKRCHGTWPADLDLAATVRDIKERLDKYEAYLILGCQRPRNQKAEVKLQVMVKGSSRIALTLFEVRRGSEKSQGHFLLPKAIA